MTDGNEATPTVLVRVLHREVLALLVLTAAGIALFLLTSALAADNARLRHSDAVAWHEQGRRALERGDTPRALDALRRASHIDRGNRDVLVSLAMALRSAGEDEQAMAVLNELRAARPDDAEVNLQLARLEAARNALPEAIRYYQDALDGLWGPSDAEGSRTVRREFITLLQQHGERARALSQALVYAAELPPGPEWQVRAGRLLLDLGDSRRALDRFLSVLSAEPHNRDALAGAGEAAFALGDYGAARRYLLQVPEPDERLASERQIADLVLTADPLAPRISAAERERRLQKILQHARDRLMTCSDTSSLQAELDAFQPSTPARQRSAPAGGADIGNRFDEGVALAARVEQATAACGPAGEFGRAVTIIARRRGLEESR